MGNISERTLEECWSTLQRVSWTLSPFKKQFILLLPPLPKAPCLTHASYKFIALFFNRYHRQPRFLDFILVVIIISYILHVYVAETALSRSLTVQFFVCRHTLSAIQFVVFLPRINFASVRKSLGILSVLHSRSLCSLIICYTWLFLCVNFFVSICCGMCRSFVYRRFVFLYLVGWMCRLVSVHCEIVFYLYS